MPFTVKYQPTALNQCLFPDQETADIIHDTAANLTDMNLVLYGPMGTGKSLMAQLIAEELSKDRIATYERFEGATYTTAAKVQDLVKLIEAQNKYVNMLAKRRLYIIEEFDRIDTQNQIAFGYLMSTPDVQFVFTTNHVANIDQRLLSRAHLCHITGGTQKDMLTLTQHVIQTEGVTATDAELNNHVQKAKGNVRDLMNNLEAFVLLKRKKTTRAATAAVPALPVVSQPIVQTAQQPKAPAVVQPTPPASLSVTVTLPQQQTANSTKPTS
jgi:replication-associated recombination protein RarA